MSAAISCLLDWWGTRERGEYSHGWQRFPLVRVEVERVPAPWAKPQALRGGRVMVVLVAARSKKRIISGREEQCTRELVSRQAK